MFLFTSYNQGTFTLFASYNLGMFALYTSYNQGTFTLFVLYNHGMFALYTSYLHCHSTFGTHIFDTLYLYLMLQNENQMIWVLDFQVTVKVNWQCLIFQDERGKWEYRYLFVDLDRFPRKTIVIEDNR